VIKLKNKGETRKNNQTSCHNVVRYKHLCLRADLGLGSATVGSAKASGSKQLPADSLTPSTQNWHATRWGL
jgi:hypothetical protein